MVSVSGIIKQYGTEKVLDEVSANSPTGKLMVFIGSNGAGESTLLFVVTRTLGKNEEEVPMEGRSLDGQRNREPAKYLSVPRQPNRLSVHIKVRELVPFGCSPHNHRDLTAEDKEKIDEAITYMGLEKLTGRYLDEPSGGQRQVARVAMAITQDTKYTFLDEPLNNLDMKHSVQIMTTLRRLVHKWGKMVVVVIHNISFVFHHVDYIVTMKDGKIVIGGDVDGMMNSHTLEQVYRMDIEVKNANNRKVCSYYSVWRYGGGMIVDITRGITRYIIERGEIAL